MTEAFLLPLQPDTPADIGFRALDAIGMHVCVLDREGAVVYVNRMWRESGLDCGCPMSRPFVGSDYLAQCHDTGGESAPAAAEFAAGLRSVLHGDAGECSVEYPCESSGERRWFQARATPFGVDGAAVIVLHSDITQRKLAEAALRESEERFRSIVETAREGIVIVGPKGVVEYLNPWAAELLGRPHGEVLGKPLSAFVPDADRERHAAVMQGKTRGPRDAIELRFERGDGATIWVQATIGRGLAVGGRDEGTMVMFDDMTAMKRREVEATQSKEAFRRLSARLQSVREEERTRFAQEIHDELGAALTRIKLDASWLGRTNKASARADRSPLIKLTEDIDAAIGTVRRIASDLRPSLLDHLGLAAAIEWEARQFEERSGTACRVTVEGPEAVIDADRATAVFRIFQEALTNVARHAAATAVTVALDYPGGQVRLRVTDDGKGIDQKRLRALQSLGLLGMRERALSFGGSLEIGPARPRGTMVELTMPIVSCDGKR